MTSTPAHADAMGAADAWAWLQAHPGLGVRSGRLTAYRIDGETVEVEMFGSSEDVRQAEFLNDFGWRTFRPIDVTEYGMAG